jgi:UDPglucose 6-dehydrogenase
MSHIVVIGSGVVGKATGKGFIKKGHQVTFVDVLPATIDKLRAEGLHACTIGAVDWRSADILMVTVPTPTEGDQISLEYVGQAAADIGKMLKTTDRYIVAVMRSTVPPTTTEKFFAPIIESHSGKRAGVDFGVAMNPEFLRQAVAEQDFARPWITVIGSNDPKTTTILEQLYKPFGALIANCTSTEAETIKYVNNIYNAVKISYFNEVHAICKQLGVDGDLVGSVVARSAESMWNPLYGTKGGVPYGGACLPKDTKAFAGFARQMGFEHLMLDATMEVNDRLQHKVPAVANPADMDLVRQKAEAAAALAEHEPAKTAHTAFAMNSVKMVENKPV